MNIQAPAESRVKELVCRGKKFLGLYDIEGYEEAVPLFREAIEADPSCAEAHGALAETYSFWGFRREISGLEGESLYEMAHEYASMALKLAPQSAGAHRAMSVALRRGRKADPELRLKEAQAAVDLGPADPANWAELWRARGYEPGDRALSRALELDPLQCGLQIDLGAVYCERGDYGKAVEALSTAVKANRGNIVAWYDLAMCLDRMGDSERARELMGRLQALHPRDPLVTSGVELLGAGK